MDSTIVNNSAFVGGAAALTAASLWAAATLMFGRLGKQLSPLVLNLVKGVFALIFIAITLVAQSTVSGRVTLPSQTPTATVYLLLSGGIGIGLGDTAYFSAINTLGVRKALLLETLAPPVAAVLAWIFLSETLSLLSVTGIVLTLIGIAWVISERTPGTDHTKRGAGIRVALLAVFCQASGAVLSRAALADTVVDPLWSSLLRLVAGIVFMGAIALIQPYRLGEYEAAKPPIAGIQSHRPNDIWQNRWQQSIRNLKTPSLLLGVGMAAFFGTYLGIWLQQISLKYTAAGIAQALLATSPLFVLPMAAMLGDRITWRALLGALIALGGVWLLLYYA